MKAGKPSHDALREMMADTELLVKLNIDVPESKRRKLKLHAISSGKTMRELVEGFIDTLPE